MQKRQTKDDMEVIAITIVLIKQKNISAKCRVKWRNSIINAEWKARIIFFLREKEISSTHWAVEADLLLILVFFTKSHYDTVFFCLKA